MLMSISSPYNTVMRRIMSLVLDKLLLLPLIALPVYLHKSPFGLVRGSVLIAFAISILSPLIYFIVLHALYGQTGGKRVCNIRVMDYNEQSICRWWQAGIRELVPFLLLLGVALSTRRIEAVFVAGVAWALLNLAVVLMNHKRRSLYDIIGNTVVVQYTPAENYFESLKQGKTFPD